MSGDKDDLRSKFKFSQVESGGMQRITIDCGKPPPRYKEGERCKNCKGKLSIYTPLNVCNLCLSKKISEILARQGFVCKNPSHRRAGDTNVTQLAIRLLKARPRSPLPSH